MIKIASPQWLCGSEKRLDFGDLDNLGEQFTNAQAVLIET